MTQQQRTAMRQEIIGPCTKEQKKELREWLEGIGEAYEEIDSSDLFPSIRWFTSYKDWGQTNDEYITPTITFDEFKQKYMKKHELMDALWGVASWAAMIALAILFIIKLINHVGF